MGYHTTFVLEAAAIPGLNFKQSHTQCLKIIAEEIDSPQYYLTGGDTLKWYSYADDLKAISVKYPKMAFKISGVGEDLNDVWWMDFYGGKVTDSWKKACAPLQLSPKTLALYCKTPN